MSNLSKAFAASAVIALLAPAAFGADDSRFELKYAKDFRFKGGRVAIANSFGNVNVRTTGGSEVEIRATIRSSDPEFGRQIRVIAGTDANGVSARTEFPDRKHSFANHMSYSVDYDVAIPANAPISVSAKFGNATVAGTSGPVNIDVTQGNIRVRGSRGKLDLTNSFGGIHVTGSAGDVVARNTNGPISVADAEGPLDLSSRFGPVKVERSTRAVSVRGANGPIKINDAAGPVTLVNAFGPVTASGIRGKLDVTTANGPVALSTISGDVRVRTSFGALVLDGVTGNVDVENQNGAIIMRGLSPTACQNISLRTANSSIHVALPPSSNYAVNAKTAFGSIRSELPLKITASTDEILRGSLGTGACKLNLENQNGSITLTR